jgi:pyruvate-ferredoxin/flavodoxin oxidoreductase
LYRFQPSEVEDGQPFKLDSKPPSIPVAEFAGTETRFAILTRTHPDSAARLAALAQADVDERWRYYTQLAAVQRTIPHAEVIEPEVESDAGYRYESEDDQ